MNDVRPCAFDCSLDELLALRRVNRSKGRGDAAQRSLDAVVIDVKAIDGVPMSPKHIRLGSDDSIFAATLLIPIVSDQDPHLFSTCAPVGYRSVRRWVPMRSRTGRPTAFLDPQLRDDVR